MTSIFLGIDPGLTGAIAFYRPANGELFVFDMPVAGGDVNPASLCLYIKANDPCMAMVERVHSMPGNGTVSSFRFGCGYGMVLGVLAALEIPTHLVEPRRWKSFYSLTADKSLSRARATQFWPKMASAFEKVKAHGRAEAALLARYGSEYLKRPGEANTSK